MRYAVGDFSTRASSIEQRTLPRLAPGERRALFLAVVLGSGGDGLGSRRRTRPNGRRLGSSFRRKRQADFHRHLFAEQPKVAHRRGSGLDASSGNRPALRHAWPGRIQLHHQPGQNRFSHRRYREKGRFSHLSCDLVLAKSSNLLSALFFTVY